MDTYRSPLHIIPSEVIDHFISADQLKQVRKEVLLEFELTGTTTIKVKGKEYDKSAVLHAFEQLEQHFSHHFLLYRDKSLLRFIEDGDMSLFYEQRTWEDLGPPDFRNWLGPIFQHRLQKIIHKCIQVKGYHSIRRLKVIHQAKLQLPNIVALQSYAKAYDELSYVVLETEKTLASPFQKNKGIRLKKNIDDYINNHYLAVFKWLPFHFERLRQKYTIAAHNFIASVFGKNRYFRSYRVEELKVLKIAADISAAFRPDLNAGSLARQLEMEIDGRVSNDVNWGENAGFRPIVFIIGLIIFSAIISNLLNSPSTKRPSPKLPTVNHIFQRAEVLQAKVMGTCWMSESVTNKEQLHFFAFHNDSIGEYAILLPLGNPGDYASLSIAFTWKISGFDKKKNLSLVYADKPSLQIGGNNQLSVEQQQLLEQIQEDLVSNPKKIPLYFQFPEDLIFYDDFFGTASSLRFRKMKETSWNTFVDIPTGDHPFIDKQIDAIRALSYLKECKSKKSKRSDFQLFVNPEDLTACFKRGTNKSPIGQLHKKKGQWVLHPQKWSSKDDENLPVYYIEYESLRYIDQHNQLKTGDIRVYIKSFTAGTCQVVAL